MIARLRGLVVAVGATSAVVETGGIGTLVQCTPHTAAGLRLDAPATLHTHLVVREDALTLYGFAEQAERDCFELLLSASGIGPRIAQAACAVLRPEELQQAVAGDDVATLVRIPGVGKKGAERICIELRDKVHVLGRVSTPVPAPTGPAAAAWREQVSAGLQGLGWSARDAEAACDRVAEQAEAAPAPSVAELMRAALRSLARG